MPPISSAIADPQSRRRLAWIALLLAVPAFVLAVELTTPLVPLNRGFDSDGVFYGSMAVEPAAVLEGRHVAPYCWRVLTPLIASLLPVPVLDSFLVLAFVSSCLNLWLCFALLLAVGVTASRAVWGTALFAGVFWVVKFSFYSPAYVDYLTITFSLAILLASVRHRFAWIPLLLVLGVLQKETILFLAPVVYARYATENGWLKRRSLAYGGLGLVLLPALTLMAVRWAIQPENAYTPTAAYWLNVRQALDPEFWPRFALATISGLGLLPAMILFRPRSVGAFLRANLDWLAMLAVGSLLLFGGVDKARLFLFMLPAVLVCALHATDVGERTSPGWLAAWMSLTLLVQLHLGHLLTPMGTFEEYISRMAPMHANGLSYRPYLLANGALIATWWLTTVLVFRRSSSPSRPSTEA